MTAYRRDGCAMWAHKEWQVDAITLFSVLKDIYVTTGIARDWASVYSAIFELVDAPYTSAIQLEGAENSSRLEGWPEGAPPRVERASVSACRQSGWRWCVRDGGQAAGRSSLMSPLQVVCRWIVTA